MSWTHLKDKPVTTRKSHRCWGCAELFDKGTKMLYRAGADDGKIYSFYYCPVCTAYEPRIDYDDGDDIGLGDFKEYDDYKDFKADFLNKAAILSTSKTTEG